MVEHHIDLPDEAATLRLGAALAPAARNGLILHLRGELGSGKTTLVRGLIRGLGSPERVKSPTYTLLEHYTISRLNLYHFDFYRFKDPTEWLSSGFQEHFGPDTLCVVEWPERAGVTLAPPDLEAVLQFHSGGRRARLQAPSVAGEAWLASALARFSAS
jgi:tRNA threonylcarbamoyladenosine biosynthesis protein TsaE